MKKEPILYRLTRPIIKFLFNILYRPTYLGLENIPKTGRVVLAGNHTHNFDCLLLISSTTRTIHFLAKDELVKGFKKVIFNNMGIIPVNRKIHDKQALKIAITLLKEDKVIGIFPEGTYPKNGELLLPFKIGAVKMAYETSSPLIPFTITGKYHLLRKGPIIEFYSPLKVTDNLDFENNQLRETINQNLQKRRSNL